MNESAPARRFRLTAPVRVLMALLLGAAAGMALSHWDKPLALHIAEIADPIGQLWINALKMTVVPLVTALVIVGVNTASNAATSGRTARNAIVVFAVLLVAAAAFAAVVTPALLSLVPDDSSTISAFRALAAQHAAQTHAAPPTATQWVVSLIPDNVLKVAADNAMLPLVVFAMFFGFALSKQEEERRARILDIVKTIGDTMITIIQWVLWVAPLGVFALIFVVCARVGLSALGALGYYIVTMSALYILITLLMYVVVALAARENLRRFAAALIPVQIIAASTSSSIASLPTMIDSARNRLGYPASLTSLVLPMAVSLFRITSPAQYIGVACFIAWLYGIDITASQYAVAILLAAAMSMGSSGLPGQAVFMTNNMPVTQSLGLPVEPLGMLLAVDNLPDVFCTIGNTTADMAATAIVARKMTEQPDEA